MGLFSRLFGEGKAKSEGNTSMPERNQLTLSDLSLAIAAIQPGDQDIDTCYSAYQSLHDLLNAVDHKVDDSLGVCAAGPKELQQCFQYYDPSTPIKPLAPLLLFLPQENSPEEDSAVKKFKKAVLALEKEGDHIELVERLSPPEDGTPAAVVTEGLQNNTNNLSSKNQKFIYQQFKAGVLPSLLQAFARIIVKLIHLGIESRADNFKKAAVLEKLKDSMRSNDSLTDAWKSKLEALLTQSHSSNSANSNQPDTKEGDMVTVGFSNDAISFVNENQQVTGENNATEVGQDVVPSSHQVATVNQSAQNSPTIYKTVPRQEESIYEMYEVNGDPLDLSVGSDQQSSNNGEYATVDDTGAHDAIEAGDSAGFTERGKVNHENPSYAGNDSGVILSEYHTVPEDKHSNLPGRGSVLGSSIVNPQEDAVHYASLNTLQTTSATQNEHKYDHLPMAGVKAETQGSDLASSEPSYQNVPFANAEGSKTSITLKFNDILSPFLDFELPEDPSSINHEQLNRAHEFSKSLFDLLDRTSPLDDLEEFLNPSDREGAHFSDVLAFYRYIDGPDYAALREIKEKRDGVAILLNKPSFSLSASSLSDLAEFVDGAVQKMAGQLGHNNTEEVDDTDARNHGENSDAGGDSTYDFAPETSFQGGDSPTDDSASEKKVTPIDLSATLEASHIGLNASVGRQRLGSAAGVDGTAADADHMPGESSPNNIETDISVGNRQYQIPADEVHSENGVTVKGFNASGPVARAGSESSAQTQPPKSNKPLSRSSSMDEVSVGGARRLSFIPPSRSGSNTSIQESPLQRNAVSTVVKEGADGVANDLPGTSNNGNNPDSDESLSSDDELSSDEPLDSTVTGAAGVPAVGEQTPETESSPASADQSEVTRSPDYYKSLDAFTAGLKTLKQQAEVEDADKSLKTRFGGSFNPETDGDGKNNVVSQDGDDFVAKLPGDATLRQVNTYETTKADDGKSSEKKLSKVTLESSRKTGDKKGIEKYREQFLDVAYALRAAGENADTPFVLDLDKVYASDNGEDQDAVKEACMEAFKTVFGENHCHFKNAPEMPSVAKDLNGSFENAGGTHISSGSKNPNVSRNSNALFGSGSGSGTDSCAQQATKNAGPPTAGVPIAAGGPS